jgi:pyruvate/2-oxoglutarate dehydrogenase complex dihydrolipoamide dehydrogenase (E3) component
MQTHPTTSTMVLWACQALILLSSVSNVIAAVQFPVKVPWVSSDNESILPTKGPAANPRQPLRIAIVGAGAGGSSAAFWLHKAKERFGYDIEVDVYEQHDYIGGSERHNRVFPVLTDA